MDDTDSQSLTGRIERRTFLGSLGGALVAAGTASGDASTVVTGAATQEDEEEDGQEDDQPDPGERITSARRIGPRDVHAQNYHMLWAYRKRQAVETLLLEPAVHDVASDWVASFEAYDPLSNDLDAISIQGTTGMSVTAERMGVNLDVTELSAEQATLSETTFKVTAENRQVAYGLVDRTTDELVGVHVTDPMDVKWERGYTNAEQLRRHQFTLGHDEVWQHLEERQWYPFVKVAEVITAYDDFPHGAVTPIAYYFETDDGGLALLSTFVDVSGDSYELLDVTRVDDFVRMSPMDIAARMTPTGDSQLGSLPVPPMDQRPQITGPQGFHNISTPPSTIEQSNWTVRWDPPVTEGAVVDASYNGETVFEDLAAMATPTGYDLPVRDGRNTREWFFPEDEPVFSGDLLYWDIHSPPFGGPGVLGKTDYPATGRHPEGFRFRTHYHTGALPNARDFHSGHRFGPYNYYINFDFYEDGVFMPSWQRQGPGYITEYLNRPERRERDGPVQFYLSFWAFRPLPAGGSPEVSLFDGDEWRQPDEEFYVEGDELTQVRFTNRSSDHTIDIPLDDQSEMVVVRRHADEIGEAVRVVDAGPELEFYHPAQYVDGESIQNRDLMAWLILEAPIHEVPHPSGIATYTSLAEMNLSGYE